VKKFTVILARNFIGMIFVIFVVVYFLFNALTNNFISEEARRELARDVQDAENLAHGRGLPFIGISPYRQPLLPIDEMLIYMEQVRSLRRLTMNTDGIIINEFNEIISPDLARFNDEAIAEIFFLANYYVGNSALFGNGEMVRLSSENNSYYMMSTQFMIADDISFSILLYTDITAMILFMRSINFTLGILLVVSGLVATLLSIFMSLKVQRAIVRLCKYAEIVGIGKFGEPMDNFDFKEFNDLAQSMNTMSSKLEVSENNQKQFFQNVSHELRTPLMSIHGYAEGIFADVLDKTDASKIIMNESERMEDLVSQLLYISRMDSGLNSIDISSVSISNLIYDCAGRVQILADKFGKRINLNLPEAEIDFKTDDSKLQTAIDNILTNCLRHANLAVDIHYRVEGKNLLITIKDDGDGITPADLPFIFDRFYKGVNGNSGLGLAISKDIIAMLGGNIIAMNINDADIAGAKFIITLPERNKNHDETQQLQKH
jgi:signal transduction histidine kinase